MHALSRNEEKGLLACIKCSCMGPGQKNMHKIFVVIVMITKFFLQLHDYEVQLISAWPFV